MTTLAALSRSVSSVHCHGLRQARPQPRPFTAAVRSSSCNSSSLHVRSSRQQYGAVAKDMLLKPLQATEKEGATFDYDEPETAKEAIDLGLVMCKQQKWDKALSIFEKGLSLPGTGVKRFRDKPKLISDGEKMASLYNIACCHAQLQDARSGLVALSGCLELGYTDYGQIRTDPDLEFLRKDPRFEGLMDRFQKKSGGFFSGLFGNK